MDIVKLVDLVCILPLPPPFHSSYTSPQGEISMIYLWEIPYTNSPHRQKGKRWGLFPPCSKLIDQISKSNQYLGQEEYKLRIQSIKYGVTFLYIVTIVPTAYGLRKQ